MEILVERCLSSLVSRRRGLYTIRHARGKAGGTVQEVRKVLSTLVGGRVPSDPQGVELTGLEL